MTTIDTLPKSFPTPWAARAFAIVSALSQSRWIDLKEFQRELISSIASLEHNGGCISDEGSYYDCWVVALTAILQSKGLPIARIQLHEDDIRTSLIAMTHMHDDYHDHDPAPIYTEKGL